MLIYISVTLRLKHRSYPLLLGVPRAQKAVYREDVVGAWLTTRLTPAHESMPRLLT